MQPGFIRKAWRSLECGDEGAGDCMRRREIHWINSHSLWKSLSLGFSLGAFRCKIPPRHVHVFGEIVHLARVGDSHERVPDPGDVTHDAPQAEGKKKGEQRELHPPLTRQFLF